jgi:hypothetical protein
LFSIVIVINDFYISAKDSYFWVKEFTFVASSSTNKELGCPRSGITVTITAPKTPELPAVQ